MIRIGISSWRYEPWRRVWYPEGLPQRRELEFCGRDFFASGVLALRDKLGPFLWQLPPTLAYDRDRLEAFFGLLLRNTARALALARRRDARMTGRVRLTIDADRPLRHAVEVRRPSFVNDEFDRSRKRHGVTVVVRTPRASDR